MTCVANRLLPSRPDVLLFLGTVSPLVLVLFPGSTKPAPTQADARQSKLTLLGALSRMYGAGAA
jgi:hypothetical protein